MASNLKQIYLADFVTDKPLYTSGVHLLRGEKCIKLNQTSLSEYAAHLLVKSLGLFRPATKLAEIAENCTICGEKFKKGHLGLLMDYIKTSESPVFVRPDAVSDVETWSRIALIFILDRLEWPDVVRVGSRYGLLDLEYTFPLYRNNKRERLSCINDWACISKDRVQYVLNVRHSACGEREALIAIRSILDQDQIRFTAEHFRGLDFAVNAHQFFNDAYSLFRCRLDKVLNSL